MVEGVRYVFYLFLSCWVKPVRLKNISLYYFRLTKRSVEFCRLVTCHETIVRKTNVFCIYYLPVLQLLFSLDPFHELPRVSITKGNCNTSMNALTLDEFIGLQKKLNKVFHDYNGLLLIKIQCLCIKAITERDCK